MAMITCLECMKSVSEFAEACPNCGVKLTKESVEKAKAKEDRVGMVVCGGMVGGIGFMLLLMFLTSGAGESRRDTTVRATPTSTKTVLGNYSSDRAKHQEDARKYLLNQARAAVRSGQMTKTQFEAYTGASY